MHIGVFGINFKTAPLVLHEMIARSALAVFHEIPIVLLSTCNRTEIYFSSDDLLKTKNELQALLGVGDCFYSYFEKDCFAHLCKVTAGLDSAILFETDIARQVKMAYANACNQFALPRALHYVFQKAFKVAKSVRARFLGVEPRGPTLFNTLWEIAQEAFLDVSACKVFLVGNSETHRKLAAFLQHKEVREITVCSRQPENVLGFKSCNRDSLPTWSEYDLISCATQADSFVICGKGCKKHLIFDLSVPRNVDPEVGSEQVKLLNIEQINQRIAEKKEELKEPLEKAEEVLWENVLHLVDLYLEKSFSSC